MATKTTEFSMRGLDDFLNQLEAGRSFYDGEEEAMVCAGVIFTLLGIIGGPAGVCVTAGLLTTALAAYYDTAESTITTATEKIQEAKDFLQNHPNFNMVRLELTYITTKVVDKYYMIPSDFKIVAAHTTNPAGWVMW